MNILFIGSKSIIFVLLCFVWIVGCALTPLKKDNKDIPVSWSTGFIMPDLVVSSGSPLNRVRDLPQLIKAPWYTTVTVSQTKSGKAVLSTCADYFDNAQPSTRTTNAHEMNAYIELKMMCEATRLLINATSSQESFLPDTVLGADLPKLWPKVIALQISAEESKRIEQNSELNTWNDVTPIIKYESQSETKSVYFHDGGYQEVEILGRGDANSDHVEDIFIIVRDHVHGGDYFNMRLFVLSVNAQGDWEVISGIDSVPRDVHLASLGTSI